MNEEWNGKSVVDHHTHPSFTHYRNEEEITFREGKLRLLLRQSNRVRIKRVRVVLLYDVKRRGGKR